MTAEITLVLSAPGFTICPFVTEVLRVDVIAILIMLALGWLGLVTPQQIFSGLASNAVVSIMAVMILGYGVDWSRLMNRATTPIMRFAGKSESRLVTTVSGVVGVISPFMQNVGAAALFLPAMLRLAKRARLPASRLLMPMGFAAILGGTISMWRSGKVLALQRDAAETAAGRRHRLLHSVRQACAACENRRGHGRGTTARTDRLLASAGPYP
jgi:Na+/H+ antiporter NhaD/arsenite permease-like protein